ncbi:MAG: ATP-binding protein [Parazoarcus communis]
MGRLFWKFFVYFWLAQLLTSIGVGATIWLTHRDDPRPQQGRGGPPPEWVTPGAGRAPPPPPPMPPPGGLPFPLLPLLAGGVVSLLFAAALAVHFARPIRRLRAAFEDLAEGRLDTRVGAAFAGRRDDLAALGDDFDRMAERLQQLLDSQRSLLHDVSHEMRSPLARLQAMADLLRQRPERSAELLERFERETDRMDRLVGELLSLARLEAGGGAAAGDPLDLVQVLTQLCADAGVEAERLACHVELDAPPHLPMVGHAALLQRAVENVVRNALQHSPSGGHVRVRAAVVSAHAVVTVEDQGPGVAVDELPAIFLPFRRGERAGPHEGFGLGLAIAARICAQHGGDIQASRLPEGGLRVTLRFSVTPAGAAA